MELTSRNAVGHDDRKNSFDLSSRKLVKIINLTGEYQRLEILSPAVAIPRFKVWDNYLTQLCLHTESYLSSVRLAEKIRANFPNPDPNGYPRFGGKEPGTQDSACKLVQSGGERKQSFCASLQQGLDSYRLGEDCCHLEPSASVFD